MKASIGRTCMTLPIAIPAIVIHCLAAQTSTDEVPPVLALQIAFVRSMIALGHRLPAILFPRIVGTAHGTAMATNNVIAKSRSISASPAPTRV